jgi:hypothetical protein
MNFEQAKALIEHECFKGVAYTSRHGEYPDRARFGEILEALRVIHHELRGHDTIDRKLASALFVISDQVQGNMSGAHEKGIKIDFSYEQFFELNRLISAIFEDCDVD